MGEDKKGTGCAYCERPSTEINTKEGYVVLWDDVQKELDELLRNGMQRDQAVTKSINDHLVYVTGSTICKIKSTHRVIEQFWKFYAEQKEWLSTEERFKGALKETCEYFEKTYPGAWKCFCGRKDFKDTEFKTKGDVAGLKRKGAAVSTERKESEPTEGEQGLAY